MAEGIQIKNLPSTTTIKQGDTMTIVQDKQNKQLSLYVFANESDLGTLSPLENRCDEVKAKIEVDEYSAEITTSQSMSKIGSDDSGVDLHENVLDGAFESCVLKGKTKYRDIDTGEILETFEEGRNLELITVRMPILSTVGKNLFNCTNVEDINNSYTVVNMNNQNYITTDTLVEKGKQYTLSLHANISGAIGNVLSLGYMNYSNIVGGVEKASHNILTIDSMVDKTTSITFTAQTTDYIKIYIATGKAGYNVVLSNVQIEEGSTTTTYEPHKSSILSLPEEVVLRSLPDGTCDTLNVETGEYVQKIGERNYQDGDTNSNTLVTDGTKTHYKLSSPIITKVDVQGFPHAYKNGHIQLSSGSTEPSLTPTVTYKVPVSRVGQIASNTKSNLRQTIKLDQLEVLVYQSLINTEYENLLVQNSVESATSFTNLSTNDPKDELYYMLKHLIEEDQPVQNMLDKINLFYLYGLLNDEHYFDLLLGGEEDVY